VREDGMSSKAVMRVGFVVPGPSAVLFRFAHGNSRNRKWLEWFSGAAFMVLVVAHFIFG